MRISTHLNRQSCFSNELSCVKACDACTNKSMCFFIKNKFSVITVKRKDDPVFQRSDLKNTNTTAGQWLY
jgi:hypothetical protein